LSDRCYDVAIVGAGVVGSAIARELTNSGLDCVLIDAANDVGKGASKANTAILHTGFDARPGSLEASLVARGHNLLRGYAKDVGIATEEVGALLIAWNQEQAGRLPAIADKARANGYRAIRKVDRDELYAREPALAPGATAALLIPDEWIICPWTTTLAFATEAVLGGCELRLGSCVEAIERPRPHLHTIHTSTGVVHACWLVNAGGASGDAVHLMAGYTGFRIRPRRGELIVFDKLARPLIRHILLPVPTAVSKGVLITPTVYGNVLLGPTSEEVADKDDNETTQHGIDELLAAGARILPPLLEHEVTAVYAGVRPATDQADYQLGVNTDSGYAWAAGIRSTGVSASLAIAEWLASRMSASRGPRPPQRQPRFRMPPLGEKQQRPYASAEAIAANPDFGRLICFCERVSQAELLAAMNAPIPAADLDGLRRRTRALMGRCQGFFCAATLNELLENPPPPRQTSLADGKR
jgi:glycerol-3-phosphate dehydrogenase